MTRELSLGDKVRVSSQYFIAELRCRTGRVAAPPGWSHSASPTSPVIRFEGGEPVYWIEFDLSDDEPLRSGDIDAAEISSSDLVVEGTDSVR